MYLRYIRPNQATHLQSTVKFMPLVNKPDTDTARVEMSLLVINANSTLALLVCLSPML
jgi:hypothetical protein